MLDDKLAQHVASCGTTAPVKTTDTVTDITACNNRKTETSTVSMVSVHKRQNSQDSKALGGRLNSPVNVGGGNQNGRRGHKAHELSDSSDEEVEQPVRVRHCHSFGNQPEFNSSLLVLKN